MKLKPIYYTLISATMFPVLAKADVNTVAAENVDNIKKEIKIKPVDAVASKNDSIATPDTFQVDMVHPVATHSTMGKGLHIIYQFSDGSVEHRRDGSRAWRNNNPGNIIKSDFATANGAIGGDTKFAVFPDYETGLKALRRLLKTDTYQKLTIDAALRKYDPSCRRYKTMLRNITGLSTKMRLNQLNNEQFDAVVNAIEQIEGWHPGKIERVESPQLVANNIAQAQQQLRAKIQQSAMAQTL